MKKIVVQLSTPSVKIVTRFVKFIHGDKKNRWDLGTKPPKESYIADELAHGHIVAAIETQECSRCKSYSANKLPKAHFDTISCVSAGLDSFYTGLGYAELTIKTYPFTGRLTQGQVDDIVRAYDLPCIYGRYHLAPKAMNSLISKFICDKKLRRGGVLAYLSANGMPPLRGADTVCEAPGCGKRCGSDGARWEDKTDIINFCKDHADLMKQCITGATSE